jgi:hypothetical protein
LNAALHMSGATQKEPDNLAAATAERRCPV